ncbi:MAG: cbb3-type cytochrome c oxidase subunit II [Armatimonadota bacterium]|nr:cbb3-type cytochrome c oxidase subunit II [Armatimonadota bacterium]MDW8157134.1 cbb3-type cytochrome c oxidase subunit II [Armatimonadota bacterium]
MKDSVGAVVRLVTAAVLCGFVASVLLPALDPAVRAARATPLSHQAARGRWVYVREGCAVCHTQEVRAVEARFGMVRGAGDIGEASSPAQYAGQDPALVGRLRLGPDLTHVAARTSAQDLRTLLRSGKGGMPPYRYLSEAEVADLVAYLLTLR